MAATHRNKDRVLLVEDSPDDRELARLAFRHAGVDCHVESVEDGLAAVRHLLSADPQALPHLVLLDLNLPKLTGAEVLRQWRARPHLQTLPVVVFSTSNEPRDIEHAYAAGATSYIVKPMDFRVFIHTLADVCHYWLGLNHSYQRSAG